MAGLVPAIYRGNVLERWQGQAPAMTKWEASAPTKNYGISTVLPVVFRASSAICAFAASASGNV